MTVKRRHISPARLAYLKMRREKAAARLVHCTVVDFTRAQWFATLKQFDYQCAYCHRRVRLSKDHVIPLNRGGDHTVSNIVPACKRCNSSKGDLSLAEWMGSS